MIHRTIRLENGLTALLISDPSRPVMIDDQESSEESSVDETSGSEAESDASGLSAASDHLSSSKKADFDEEKQVSLNDCFKTLLQSYIFKRYNTKSYYILC